MIGGYLPGPQIVLKVSNFQPYEMVLVGYRRLQSTAGQAISAVLSRDKVGFFCKAVIAVMSFAIPTEILPFEERKIGAAAETSHFFVNVVRKC